MNHSNCLRKNNCFLKFAIIILAVYPLTAVSFAMTDNDLAANMEDLSPVTLLDCKKSEEEPKPILSENEHSQVQNIPTQGSADPPTILTTRPTFTDAWLAVPQGSIQSENGATYSDFSNRTRSWLLPETLLKLGLGPDTELRFSTPNYTYIRSDETGRLANNFGDTSVGFSHHIGIPSHKIDLAFIPILNLPTGANNISTNSVDPQFRVVAARTFSPKLVVASQFDVRWNTGRNRATDVLMNPTLISYYSFTPKVVGFLEYATLIPTQGRSQHFVQYGFLYLPTPRQQLDVRMANGLNRASSDLVIGFGYSFRVDGFFGKSRAYSSFK